MQFIPVGHWSQDGFSIPGTPLLHIFGPSMVGSQKQSPCESVPHCPEFAHSRQVSLAQNAPVQSFRPLQILSFSQRWHEPPQSISLSLPFLISSPQVGAGGGGGPGGGGGGGGDVGQGPRGSPCLRCPFLAFLLTLIVCPSWQRVTFFFFFLAIEGSAVRRSEAKTPPSRATAFRRESRFARMRARSSKRRRSMARPFPERTERVHGPSWGVGKGMPIRKITDTPCRSLGHHAPFMTTTLRVSRQAGPQRWRQRNWSRSGVHWTVPAGHSLQLATRTTSTSSTQMLPVAVVWHKQPESQSLKSTHA